VSPTAWPRAHAHCHPGPACQPPSSSGSSRTPLDGIHRQRTRFPHDLAWPACQGPT
jgi:hypothetical protein